MIRACFLLAMVCFCGTAAGAPGGLLFITGDELAQAPKSVRLIDAESADAFQRAHIPGAVNLPYLDLEDSEENAKNGHPIFPQLAASKFGALGIARDTELVVYDSGNGRGASALWYILSYLGHEKVRMLDGGFRKWVKEGRAVTQEQPKPAKVTYQPKPRDGYAVKTEGLLASGALILDARELAEYTGKDMGGARQGGHIPGARSFPWTRLAGELATLKDRAAMQKVLAQAGITPDQPIVTYCNGGLGRSTFLLVALTALGYDKVKVYPGSWLEWAADPARAIER